MPYRGWRVEFNPAPDYGGLLKQARALASLVAALEEERAYLRERVKALEDQLKLTDGTAVDAERATNARLTEALVQAEARAEALKDRNEALNRELMEWNGVFFASGARCLGTLASHVAQMRAELDRLRRGGEG